MCHGTCKKNESKRAPYACVDRADREDDDIDFVEVALALPSLQMKLQGGTWWYKVSTVDEIFEIFGTITGTYQLIGGNTSIGNFKSIHGTFFLF